jgi:ubiquitin C
VDPSCTVGALKTKIERMAGIRKANQRIEIDGVCLDNPAATLHSCGVVEATMLRLTDIVPHRTFLLSITTLTGATYRVNAAGRMRIARIKFSLSLSPLGAPRDEQRLIFDGRELENDRTVADYRLSPGSTVHVVKRLGGAVGVWDAAVAACPELLPNVNPQRDALCRHQGR